MLQSARTQSTTFLIRLSISLKYMVQTEAVMAILHYPPASRGDLDPICRQTL